MSKIIWRIRAGFQDNVTIIGAGIIITLILSVVVAFVVIELIFAILPRGGDRWFNTALLPLPLVFFGTMIGVHYLAYFHPKISAFWLPEYDENKPLVTASTEQPQAVSNAPKPVSNIPKVVISDHSFEPVRAMPKGTRLTVFNEQEALLQVKSAVRFWFWFLPAALGLSTVLIAPFLGSYIGFLAYEAHPQSWTINPVSYSVTGAVWTIILFIAATIMSYFGTRQWITVKITPDAIQYGTLRFDRSHHWGMALGYSIEGDNGLKNDFHDLALGLTAIRLTYGRWGEDLPYLVSKFHAAEIIVWMNEIVSAVGAPPPKEHDLDAGRKIEKF